jgi:hypothetical protein
MRGEWRGDSTFVLNYQVIGIADRGTLQLRFDDDTVHVLLTTPEVTETLTAARIG